MKKTLIKLLLLTMVVNMVAGGIVVGNCGADDSDPRTIIVQK